MRIRSLLPGPVQRTATRYFDGDKLIKTSSRRQVHRAIAEVLASELALPEGTEQTAALLTEAVEDLVRWWDAAATAVNALPSGAGPRPLGLLPGTRLLVLDLGLRIGALLRLLGVQDDLLEVGEPAGRGLLFWQVLEGERKARALPREAIGRPLGPTRNGLKAWSRGTLPRSTNLDDLARLLVPDDGQAAARGRLRARLRLAVAMDTLHGWLSRLVDTDFAAGALRYGVEVCRVALLQPRPVGDERRWRERLWELVRLGGRAEDARFPLQVVATLAGPLEGMEAVGLARGPSALLSWWAVLLTGSPSARSGMAGARAAARSRPKEEAFEQVALRMLRMYPLGYRGPSAAPASPRVAGTDLWARFWALELIGAHARQLLVARALEQARPGPAAALLHARALRLTGAVSGAESRCRSLHAARPKWPAPLVELGECALVRQDFTEADRVLEEAHRLAPEDDQTAFTLALAKLAMGEWATSRSLLVKIMRRCPSHGPAAAALSICCSRLPSRRREARAWAKLAARLGRPEGLQALAGESNTSAPPAPGSEQGLAASGHSAPEPPGSSGAFRFTLTPVDDGLARRWRPVW